MKHIGLARTAVVLAWICAALAAVGCGGKTDALARPKSAADLRPNLEAALEAWKSGKTPDSLNDQTPPIKVTDSAWKGGQQIESYTIVNNKPAGDRAQLFTVKLSFRQPKREQEVNYVVSGNDPVYVFRDTDMAEVLSPGNEASKPGAADPARVRPKGRH
jgi:hypothetical protein